ncbi:ABC transporter substrate-binding protein [Ramlibacter sp. AW1]|uniref:ABC transporter substrate-binding protein n=1 Tax=Ramlibacter aurantiacus TaxID=2801330 RepID=A0A936ZC66_9BURK|nr:helical backbone metal receptor [Ramlibacter aurantiacus]MBL0418884.1 ABC transporter substrate-binding protein [Ramlibacter aurantiacus]
MSGLQGKGWWARLARGWLLLACMALGTARAAPVELTDDRGATRRWQAPPVRIVSLLPSLTESVCALGHCDRLVGLDRYSNWPPSLAPLPRLGGGLDPDLEAVVALRPDVVLIAPSARAVQRLESLGLKVVALEPKNHADVRRVLLLLARLTGAGEQRALRTWQQIDAAMNAAAQSLPARARGARVYFEVSRAPHAAAPGSFIGETLARLGAGNVVPTGLGPFPQLNPEFVVRADPDVIMVSDRHVPALAQRPGWSGLRALREQRVCVFSPEEGDVLVRAGPRMAEAARLMAQCLAEKAP